MAGSDMGNVGFNLDSVTNLMCVTSNGLYGLSELWLLFCYVGTRIFSAQGPQCLVQLALSKALLNE